jgi:hypothetical protein
MVYKQAWSINNYRYVGDVSRVSGALIFDMVVVVVSFVGGGRPMVVDLADDGFERRGIR